MSSRHLVITIWVGLATLTACSSPELAVELRTDFVPGVQFDQVVVTVDGASPVRTSVVLDDQFDSFRAADYGSVSSGSHTVEVTLNLRGALVVSKPISAYLDGNLLVRAVIMHSCVGVTCPGPSMPLATECFAGMCENPSCTAEIGADAGAGCIRSECTVAADCVPAAGALCVVPICERGACVLVADNTRCTVAGHYCDTATDTCLPIADDGHGPTGIMAVADSPSQVTVSWAPRDAASSYTVEIATDTDFTVMLTTFDGELTTSHAFMGRNAGTTCYARVRAVVLGNPTTWSDTAMATTSIPAPTHVSVDVSASVCCRAVPDGGTWVYASPAASYSGWYATVTGHATCPAGTSAQFQYVGTYSSGSFTGSTPWIGSLAYVEAPSGSYGVIIAVTARCAPATGPPGPTAPASRCSLRNGNAC